MPTPQSFQAAVAETSVLGTMLVPEQKGNGGPRPVVLVCAGFPGAPDDFDDLQAQITGGLSDRGMVAVTYQPRWAAAADLESCRGEQSTEDAAAVIRWLLGQDSLVDPARIGVLGYDAAAVVAACIAGRSDSVAALCLIAPTPPETVAERLEQLGGPDGETSRAAQAFADSVREMQPVEAAAGHDRPTLVLHGAADRTVPLEQSLRYFDRIRNASHQVNRVLVARADHGFTTVESRVACLEQMLGFFAAMPPVPDRAAQEA